MTHDWTLSLDRYEDAPDTPNGLYALTDKEWYTFGDATTITADERASRVEEWVPGRAQNLAREYEAHTGDHMFAIVRDHERNVVFEHEF